MKSYRPMPIGNERFRKENPHLFKQVESPVRLADKAVHLRCSEDEEKLNRWERQWLSILRQLVTTRTLTWIGVQNITLKLANDLRYTCDFFTVDVNGKFQGWEVKGFKRPKNMQKLKMAARLFPWIEFVLITKENGNWKQEIQKP